MEKISFDISKFTNREPSKIKSQRAEVLKMFVDRLNAERTGKCKPLPASFYAVKMSMLSVQDLREFYGYCDEAQNFSKTWWWSTNPKNAKQ
jgi:hypothetical protein